MGKKIIVVVLGVCLVLISVSCNDSSNMQVVNTWKCTQGQQIYDVYPIAGTDDLFVSYFEKNKNGEEERRTARIDKNGKEVWKFSSDRVPWFDGIEFVFDDFVTNKTTYFNPISGKARKTVNGSYLQSDIYGKLNIYKSYINSNNIVCLDDTGKKIWDKDINDDNSLEESFLISNKLILINQSQSMIICPWRPINETNTKNKTPKDQEYDMNLSYIECDLTITVLDYSTGKQIMKSTYSVKDSSHYEFNSKGLSPDYLRADNKDKPIIVINNMSKAIDCLTGKTIWETKEKRHFAKWIEGKPNICVFTSLNGQKVGLFDLLTGKVLKVSKTLDGQIANVDIFNNTIVCKLEYPPNNKDLDKMKMIGFDIKTGEINWEKKICWHNGPYTCNAESIELVDSNGETVECIIAENIDSKNKVISFINIDSGETLATFDNKEALEIKAIKVYDNSISLICDSAIIVGRIDHSIKKLMIICKLEFNNNGLINNHNPPENDYTPSSYYIVKDMAVYNDKKKTYIYNIETLDKVTVLDDVSFNNYAYSDNTFYLWNSSKAEKIEIKENQI